MGREQQKTVDCAQCHQAILPGEAMVCFKTPGREIYQFFHYRLRVDDCREGRLNTRK